MLKSENDILNNSECVKPFTETIPRNKAWQIDITLSSIIALGLLCFL